MQIKVVKNNYSEEVEKNNLDVGEIIIKSDTLFKGYLNHNEEADDSFTEDRWFKTGDLALMNSENYITIVDRNKDMLLCSSENVYTIEVENIINEMKNV